MGYQIVKQPDGHLAIRESYTGTLVMWDANREEVIDYFAEMAATDARENALRLADLVLDDKPRDAYYQFAVTWDAAVGQDRESGGEYSAAAGCAAGGEGEVG